VTPREILELPLPLPPRSGHLELDKGASVLIGYAADNAVALLAGVAAISESSPFRRMATPGGRMSVAMTNCGSAGWVADQTGYRYVAEDPLTGRPWPAMPDGFTSLARAAASAAGFADFSPDGCLINRYEPGSRLSLHQDRDERDFSAPIVSVSLGLPVTFLWGGQKRSDRSRRIPLIHGDVVVWGGPARKTFHGVLALAEGAHPLTGSFRYNLTLRRAR
jgi:alkylated DNA repair protein (DNA oxidative demethylase)